MSNLAKYKLFARQIDLATEDLGPPTYHCLFPGNPLGFVVGRGMNYPERRRTEGWANMLRVFLEHEFGEDFQLSCSESEQIFFFTRATYATRVHCDPENTHKLVKDVCFRNPLNRPGKNNSDKYTGGIYDWVHVDADAPGVEIWVW